MRRPARWATTAATAMAAALLGSSLACAPGPQEQAEPVQGDRLLQPSKVLSAQPAAVGEAFGFGLVTLDVLGAGAIRLRGIEAVGDAAVEQLGVRLVLPGRTYASVDRTPWPPLDPDIDPELIVPAVDAELRSGATAGYELLIGLRPAKPGKHLVAGFLVTYDELDADGEATRTRVQFMPTGLGLCVGEQQPRTCDALPAWQDAPGTWREYRAYVS